MIVYIDVLFVINLIINYFILLAVSQLLKRQDRRIRIFAGAALGAVYGSLMFFPQLSFLYTAILKLALSVTIVAVSFKCHSVKNLLTLLFYFYIISMLFGGIIYAVELFFAPSILYVKNGIAYIDISPLYLILLSAACYIVIKLLSRVLHRNVNTEDKYIIKIVVEGKSVLLTSLLDNGNDLRDAISGSPVVIAEYRRVEPLIPIELRNIFKTGKIADTELLDAVGFSRRFRIVPYGSVGNTGGILPAFRPDKLIVESAGIVTSDVLIALTNKRLSDDGRFTVLLNQGIFEARVEKSTEEITSK
jgi:stage II sporulation protein GA (sporulation sigma-E factor processing peptidase)